MTKRAEKTISQRRKTTRHVPDAGEGRSRVVQSSLAQQKGEPRYSFSTHIPETYNETYIRVIPRDPQSVYVYWEIAPHHSDASSGSIQKAARILRLTEIQGDSPEEDLSGPPSAIDIPIDNKADNWYIRLPEAGRAYTVEFGQLSPTGAFIPLTESQPVRIPRQEVTDAVDENWTSMRTDELISVSAGRVSDLLAGAVPQSGNDKGLAPDDRQPVRKKIPAQTKTGSEFVRFFGT
jgi:hypothetical protein